MVPLPVLVYNALSEPLQLFASSVAANLAQWLGVSVYRDGNIIDLANISLGVEEACSGLNSLSAMMVGSLLLGFLQCREIWSRSILFFLSIPLATAINVFRITGTASWPITGNSCLWVLSFLFRLAGVRLWVRMPVPFGDHVSSHVRIMKASSITLLAVLTMLTGTLLLVEWSDRRQAENLTSPLESISNQVDGWIMDANQTLSPAELRVPMPTSYLSREYRKDREHLELFVAYYAFQRAGETMHSPKNCLPGSGWEIWKREQIAIPAEGRSFLINKYFVQNMGKRLIVFCWYQSRERVVADEYQSKFLLVRDAVMARSTSGVFVRVVVPDDAELAQQAIAGRV